MRTFSSGVFMSACVCVCGRFVFTYTDAHVSKNLKTGWNFDSCSIICYVSSLFFILTVIIFPPVSNRKANLH